MSQKITIAYGDGIGPEIMQAVLSILRAAGADFTEDVIEVGEKVYKSGHDSGIRDKDWKTIKNNRFFLKAPITTPQGGGFKSLNVTIRNALGLFANVRPSRSLYPYVHSKHPHMDVVIIRENEEGLYTGMEYRQTHEMYECLKLVSLTGCQKITRYAFEYTRRMGRKKVTCMTKDNIMKMTDGLFHKVFEETAKEYPEIENEHWIIDIGAAKFATAPNQFDVLLLPNLYGDILSDVAAQMAGSIGIAGSGNIGPHYAMFEAIHGSAPRRAGQNVANPSGLLQAACLMLCQMGQNAVAEKIQNSWLKTIEEGIHTYDIFDPKTSRQKVGTKEFAQAIIKRLGERPSKISPVRMPDNLEPLEISESQSSFLKEEKRLDGVDIFIHSSDLSAPALADILKKVCRPFWQLKLIANRGAKVYPGENPHVFCSDHWRCRFVPANPDSSLSYETVCELLKTLYQENLEVIKTENLYSFSGQKAYFLVQGE